MALADKVAELQQAVAAIDERLDNALQSLGELRSGQKDLAREINDVRLQHEKEIALLKREAEELKRWNEEQKRAREETGRRLWAFGPNAIGALISGMISALVAYLVARG